MNQTSKIQKTHRSKDPFETHLRIGNPNAYLIPIGIHRLPMYSSKIQKIMFILLAINSYFSANDVMKKSEYGRNT